MLNRGNGRAEVFHKDDDYAAFLDLMAAANERLPMRILGYALMPNHFHLVLWPRGDGDLSRWMQWLLTVARAAVSSPLPRQRPRVARTVQGLSDRAGRAPADGAALRGTQSAAGQVSFDGPKRGPGRAWRGGRAASVRSCLSDWPVACPRNWLARVNAPQTEAELAALRRSIARGAPFGDERWSERIAKRLGLESSLRPRGRPKKSEKVECPLFFPEKVECPLFFYKRSRNMLSKRNWFLTTNCLTMFIVGCTPRIDPVAGKARGEGAIVFRLKPRTGKQAPAGTEVTFQFRNDTSGVVELPGYFGARPKDGVFRANLTQYEVQVAGKWEPLDVAYDGLPEYFSVQPGSELRLLISLGPFEKQNVPRDANVRVTLGGLMSEAFTLSDTTGDDK